MKSLWAIERKLSDKQSTILFDWERGCFAIYDFKKVARDNRERLYQVYVEKSKEVGVKHIPRKDFIIKEYREVQNESNNVVN